MAENNIIPKVGNAYRKRLNKKQYFIIAIEDDKYRISQTSPNEFNQANHWSELVTKEELNAGFYLIMQQTEIPFKEQ